MMSKKLSSLAHRILIKQSLLWTLFLALAGIGGFYLGSGIELKLSLTDLLPENHPAVLKFNKLTKIVGGVGYLTAILTAADGVSHLKAAPRLVEELKKSSLVRSAFYHREQRFFVDRMLYYLGLDKLNTLEKTIDEQVTVAKRSVFDLGLFDESEKPKKQEAFDPELKDLAKKSAKISPFLISENAKHLLMMVKPSFDSMEMAETEALIASVGEVIQKNLPPQVTFEFAGRYISKVEDSKMISGDIKLLGSLAMILIAASIFIYLRSFRSLLLIFIPVLFGLGIMVGFTRLFIGHINIITGFLMGIVSGLGVDYGIHLALRLKLEEREPSSDDPDPVWRTLLSSGHSVFIGAMAASFSFFLLCFSSFRAFSEFGFICGIGIAAVLISLLVSFSALSRLLKVSREDPTGVRNFRMELPVLSRRSSAVTGGLLTVALAILAGWVSFEYNFDKMLEHSPRIEYLNHLVDVIYDRSITPSAVAASSKEEALAVEKVLKDKYVDHTIKEIVSGASIVPENQKEKYEVLIRIKKQMDGIKDKWIENSLNVPAEAVRTWVAAKPFGYPDIPSHVRDVLRGTQESGYLIYLYPSFHLNNAVNVKRYATMVRDMEEQFPNLLTGSDAVLFSDILDLIKRDGFVILLVIFLSVGFFIWLNVRRWDDTLTSYVPLLVALPVGMGLMAILGIKFNIFNIAIIPTFVAMGIDVPIHIVHRAREVKSGFKAARDLAPSIQLALLTAALGFGVLIFARAGVLKSLGWIALLGTVAIWWIGLFILPAFLEWHYKKSRRFSEQNQGTNALPSIRHL